MDCEAPRLHSGELVRTTIPPRRDGMFDMTITVVGIIIRIVHTIHLVKPIDGLNEND